MSGNKIKYSFAKYKGNIVHINEITEQMRSEDNFYNIMTGKRMTAYLNGKVQKHFHHIEYTPHDNESYLHYTAKMLFAEIYKKSLQDSLYYTLEYWVENECHGWYKQTGIKCEMGKSTTTFNLVSKFKEIIIEEKFDEFKPDIQLVYGDNEGKREVIFIEIKVTHRSTDKKLNSKNRIIEIEISNEDDILALRNRILSVKNQKIIFYNFKLKKNIANQCSHKKGCRYYTTVFLLYNDGSYEFIENTLERIMGEIASSDKPILKIDYRCFEGMSDYYSKKDKKETYLSRIVNANFPIKHCGFCRYVGTNRRSKITNLFCKHFKKDVFPKNAWTCEAFRKPVSTTN